MVWSVTFQLWQALGTGFYRLPSMRQLSVPNWGSRAGGPLLYPGLAGSAILLRYKKSYFYFTTP